ncbi:MAG: YdbL family protein [Desulfosalsimonadaceae bacterium]
MKKQIYASLIVLVFFMTCVFSATVFAQNKEEVTANMRDRYPALQEAKNKGLVGEAWTGLVALVDAGAPSDVQALVSAENSDRKTLFHIIAQETGASIEEVAKQNRIRMYRLAEDNHFLQGKDRQWVRKKDLHL